jgi:hypothetical protein
MSSKLIFINFQSCKALFETLCDYSPPPPFPSQFDVFILSVFQLTSSNPLVVRGPARPEARCRTKPRLLTHPWLC